MLGHDKSTIRNTNALAHRAEQELRDEEGKMYWAVWFHRPEQNDWAHHGSYDLKCDAKDEADSLRRSGEVTKIVRQDW